MPNEKKVTRGKRVQFPASLHNAVVDAVKWHRQQSAAAGVPGPITNSIGPSLTILIENNAGTLLNPYQIVRIGPPLLTPSADAVNLMERVAFEGLTPTSEAAIAILQEPAAGGDIRRAVVSGITVCYVRMVDAAHQWANPLAGITTQLESSAEVGVARILWHAAHVGAPAGTELALVNLIGATGGAPDTATACDTGCGSLVGILDDWCLRLELECATGEFANMDTAQFAAVYAFGAAGTWRFKVWDDGAEDWIDFAFEWFTGSTGVPELTFAADGSPILTIDAVSDKTLKTRCAEADGTFSGGPRNGLDGDPAIRAVLEVCESNEFVLRASCSCCPIDWFKGSGWYGILPIAGDCETDPCTAVYLSTDDASACDATIQICTDRFDTEAEAIAACDLGTVAVACCPDLIPSVVYLHVVGDSCNESVALTWNGTRWDNPNATIGSCGPSTARLECIAGPAWQLSLGHASTYLQSPTDESCGPLALTFPDGDELDSCCGGTGPLAITVSEVP